MHCATSIPNAMSKTFHVKIVRLQLCRKRDEENEETPTQCSSLFKAILYNVVRPVVSMPCRSRISYVRLQPENFFAN